MRWDPTQSARSRPVLAALLWMVAGCAGTMPPPALPYGQPSVADAGLRHINGPVLQASPTRTLNEVIATYWPTFGRRPAMPLASAAGEQVGVYANDSLIGGLEDLRSIRSGDVLHLERLTRGEEFMRFGRSHPQGAVVLTWKVR